MLNISFNKLVEEVMSDKTARYAAIENNIRRRIAHVICKEMKRQCISYANMEDLMGPPASQLCKLLHNELGGPLTLYTICRALDVMGFELDFKIVPKPPKKEKK